MTHGLESVRASPNSLAPHYTQFQVGSRLLLSGHSHQAWPDVGARAQAEAFADAAALLGDKWERAFAKAERVRAGFRTLLGDSDGHIALMGSTHDAVVRFLSALPLRERPRIVTTDGEFHTLRRQLDRLSESGVEIVRVPAAPSVTLCERLAHALTASTATVMVSSVSFLSGEIVPGLRELHDACERTGVALFIDAYHHLNVAPFSLADMPRAFVTGGGYKYCQLGEGNCCLRFPRDCALRPLITGWYAEFDLLEAHASGHTDYPEGPGRFAGATYDPVSHYRAAGVLDFFAEQGLDIALLRRVSQHQIGHLCDGFDALDQTVLTRDRSVKRESLAGFLALHSPRATELASALRARGVDCDARGSVLRLGPAPYLSDAQLDQAIAILGEVARI